MMDANQTYCSNHFITHASHYAAYLKHTQCHMLITSIKLEEKRTTEKYINLPKSKENKIQKGKTTDHIKKHSKHCITHMVSITKL